MHFHHEQDCFKIKLSRITKGSPDVLLVKLIYKLGYLNDSNAAAHSVDSDIFYTVIHLQLHS